MYVENASIAALNLTFVLSWVGITTQLFKFCLFLFELLLMRSIVYSLRVTTCVSRLSAAAPWRAMWSLNKQEKVIMAARTLSQSALATVSNSHRQQFKVMQMKAAPHLVDIPVIHWQKNKSSRKKGCSQRPNPPGQQFLPTRIAKIKKHWQQQVSVRWGATEILTYCWWERKLAQTFWKTIWRNLLELSPLTQQFLS